MRKILTSFEIPEYLAILLKAVYINLSQRTSTNTAAGLGHVELRGFTFAGLGLYLSLSAGKLQDVSQPDLRIICSGVKAFADFLYYGNFIIVGSAH